MGAIHDWRHSNKYCSRTCRKNFHSGRKKHQQRPPKPPATNPRTLPIVSSFLFWIQWTFVYNPKTTFFSFFILILFGCSLFLLMCSALNKHGQQRAQRFFVNCMASRVSINPKCELIFFSLLLSFKLNLIVRRCSGASSATARDFSRFLWSVKSEAQTQIKLCN